MLLENEHKQTNGKKIISQDIMQYAKSIADIANSIIINITEDKISINYSYNNHFVNLGFCEFSIRGDMVIISEFYTSNLNGLSNKEKRFNQKPWINEIDILDKPIKDIGKEIFSNLLDLISTKGVKSICLIYNQETNALDFYKKMKKYFPTYINSIEEPIPGSLIFKLK